MPTCLLVLFGNFQLFGNSPRLSHLFATCFLLFPGTEYWRKMVVEVAKDYKNYAFAVSDDEEFAKELEVCLMLIFFFLGPWWFLLVGGRSI